MEIDDNIKSLAVELLSTEEVSEAENISEGLVKKSTRVTAIRFLKNKLGDRPKRPIYYANFELNGLPFRTRDAVRYIGDFIDNLIKCVAIEILENDSYGQKALGINLRYLEKKIPENLHSELKRYNNLIYTPAKHDFAV